MSLWTRLTQKKAPQMPPPKAPKEKASLRTRTVSRLPGLSQVGAVIAVASGKGGVGKSTVAANLAQALKGRGYRVGLMDADIYGPSQSTIMGGKGQRPENKDGQILPLESFGIKYISMGHLLGENAPVIWRAPMATKAVGQFLNVAWGELDYLIIDLPPGTGDIQITLAQQAELTGVVIVTTPQDLALGVAKKGLHMFEQVNVPILGVVENMSGLTCEACHHVNPIFKQLGGQRLAEAADAPLLVSLPLDPQIMQAADQGRALLADDTSSAAQLFYQLADRLDERVDEVLERMDQVMPQELHVNEEGDLYVKWSDETVGTISAYDLRLACPCAVCVDENTGRALLDPKTVPLDIRLTTLRPVGRYGVAVDFNHKHDTGIYKFEKLRELVRGKESAFSV